MTTKYTNYTNRRTIKPIRKVELNEKPVLPVDTPHLTPAKLVGLRFGKDMFKNVRAALVGYCPRSDRVDRYHPQNTADQYFIHVPPASVQLCSYSGMEFLSISHVYGGPVSSALVEELAFYGVQNILAYGLAGGLGTKGLKMGDFYLVEKALALDGTTPHYTSERIIPADEALTAQVMRQARAGIASLTPVQAMTGDAIYPGI